VYVCLCICIGVNVFVYVHVYIHVYVYVYAYVYVVVCLCMFVYVYVIACICIRAWVCHDDTCMYMNMYTYMYILMYMACSIRFCWTLEVEPFKNVDIRLISAISWYCLTVLQYRLCLTIYRFQRVCNFAYHRTIIKTCPGPTLASPLYHSEIHLVTNRHKAHLAFRWLVVRKHRDESATAIAQACDLQQLLPACVYGSPYTNTSEDVPACTHFQMCTSQWQTSRLGEWAQHNESQWNMFTQ